MIPPQAAAIELTAQHLILMTQDEQLGVLGQVRPDRTSTASRPDKHLSKQQASDSSTTRCSQHCR